MSEKMIESNRVGVIGETVSGFTFGHEVFGEGFYMVDAAVNRLSEQAGIIPLTIPERLIDVRKNYSGNAVECMGQFRSYNQCERIKNRLMLPILIREIHLIEEFMDHTKTNQIFLDGYICKPPIYERTPLGREIADILLVVDCSYGKPDYIPCTSWGCNARSAPSSEAGTRVRVWGRVRSRGYTRRFSEAECEKRTVYEVFISKLGYDEAQTEEALDTVI